MDCGRDLTFPCLTHFIEIAWFWFYPEMLAKSANESADSIRMYL